MSIVSTDLMKLRLQALTRDFTDQLDETDSKYFSIITFFFITLSGVAIHYQQFVTGGVLYIIAILSDILDVSVGRITGRINSLALAIESAC